MTDLLEHRLLIVSYVFLFVLLFLEFYKTKRKFDYVINVGHGMIIIIIQLLIASFLFRNVINKIIVYPYKYVISDPLELVFNVFIYIALQDFIYYWVHRFEHKNKYLWDLHYLHHSDRNMNFTTSSRNFWFESILMIITFAPIIVFFNYDKEAFLIAALIKGLWAYFTHTQFKISFGWFNKILVSPQVHRIHHSIEKKHLNHNFAQYFSFYDVIFGTYYHPKKGEYPKSGVDDGKIIGVLESIYYPFLKWFRMIKNKK